MKLTSIKTVNIIVRRSLKKELISFFRELGISGYTYLEVNGKGVRELRKTQSAEAKNIQFKILLEPILALTLMQELGERYFKSEKVIIFEQDVRIIRPGKFTRINL